MWNGWPDQRGISGRMFVEWLAECSRNPHYAPFADRFFRQASALNMRTPSNQAQPAFSRFIVIAPIGPKIPASVASIQNVSQLPTIGLAGVRDLQGTNHFVPSICTQGDFVAVEGFAVLLRPTRLDILLTAFGG